MALKGKGKVVQSGHAKTQYIGIPADIVSDSQYPFLNGDLVKIELNPKRKELVISAIDLVEYEDIKEEAKDRGRMARDSGYEEFRDAIRKVLKDNPQGLAWSEIKAILMLPQKVPNNVWVNRMVRDIGLKREAKGKKKVWRID